MRDLNDEINRLLREKRHWENQIVALGGANYRRNVAMLDDDGKEVPGTKGYKYFGRAKELPGVKELFMSKKTEEDEENKVHNYYKKFTNQGPAYFGDLDEAEGELLKFEMHAEEEGTSSFISTMRTIAAVRHSQYRSQSGKTRTTICGVSWAFQTKSPYPQYPVRPNRAPPLPQTPPKLALQSLSEKLPTRMETLKCPQTALPKSPSAPKPGAQKLRTYSLTQQHRTRRCSRTQNGQQHTYLYCLPRSLCHQNFQRGRRWRRSYWSCGRRP